MAYSQSSRFCSFDCPLGPDALLLRRMVMEESVSGLFKVELQLESESNDHKAKDLVGKAGCVKIELADGGHRYVHGIVTRFLQGAASQRLCHYSVEMRPWMWLLTRRRDCRIFQNKTVPDILAEVFEGAGFSDFEKKLKGSFPARVYCVQYRETDYDFVCRLMEEEGIFWFWKHEATRHVLVLANATTDLLECPGQGVAAYDHSLGGNEDVDTVQTWESTQELHTGKYALKDFNFEDPTNGLLVNAPTTESIGGNSSLEAYDYHIEDYGATGDGNRLVRLRIEAEESSALRMRGRGNVRAFVTGHRFELKGHFVAGNNQSYMLTSVRHVLVQPSALHSDDGGDGATTYANEFACVPAGKPFRTPLATPKPSISGPQTAIVTGPSGEEIHVDKYGRIKVQFHWDRLGRKDENSSCWLRVARNWASKQWGQVAHPRIGDEVIVEFLEGDPDKPIVTGCVYNAQAMPPYELPANKTQAGVKSRSSPGGAAANFNEIRFEDKKGEEDFYVQAEKDKNEWVKNDRTENVDHDESITIGHDQTVDIGNDQSIHVAKNRDLAVDENDSTTVGKDRTIDVSGNHTETISGDMSLTVSKNRTMSVTKNLTETVDGTMSLTVAKDTTESFQANLTVEVTKDAKLTVSGQQVVAVTKEASLSAKKIQLKADDEITLVTGSASITMKKNGDITIKGKKIEVKGSGDVIIKGSKVAQN